MFVQEIISDGFSPVSLNDTGITALNWMDEFKVAHMPVVDGSRYFGLLEESELYNYPHPEEPLRKTISKIKRPYVKFDKHVLEALRIFKEEKLSLLPVLDEKGNYHGVIRLQELVCELSKLSGVDSPGGIIVLEMNINDYSLVEIAQICESNDLKILSSYVVSSPDTTKIEVTLKLNSMELRSVVQAFNRYDYLVKATYMGSDNWQDMRDRYDYVMNYLNI